jgi:hypothetical protein
VIVFYDEKIPTAEGEKNGRTGKSLVGKAIMQFKGNSVDIPGTKFRRDDKFFFQQCNPDTEFILINELPEGFKLDNLFSEISDGMKAEQKREKIFDLIDVKILITTNSMIKGEGDSYKDRMFEIEFAPHYSESHKPIDEFRHRFFNDWDANEWLYFDNLKVYCVQLYLDNGLIPYERVNVEKRKALESIPEYIIAFFDELERDQILEKKKIYLQLTLRYPQKNISMKKFTQSLRQYCKAMGYQLKEYPGAGGSDPKFAIISPIN